MPKKIILLMGPQGSGKGTQGEKLSVFLNIPSLSVGNLLATEGKQATERGHLINDLYTQGKLIPDYITKDLVAETIAGPEYARGFLLDGYPRNLEQARDVDDIAKPTLAILFQLSDEEAIRRLAGRRVCPQCKKIYHIEYNPPPVGGCPCGGVPVQRPDDTPDALAKRLEIYHHDTEPVLQLYRDRGILIEIDAAPPIEEVFGVLKEKLLTASKFDIRN